MPDPLIEGTVVENRGAYFEVLVDGRVLRCLLRGRLKKGKQRRATPLAAGDRVKIALLEPGRGVIEEILPRESALSRTAAGSRPLQHTLVANIDQAIIVFAAAEPRPDLFMLDRFIVAAIASGLECVICINKCDLVDGEPLRARLAVYRQCGYRLLYTSAVRGEGLEDAKQVLKDRRSVICGPSGVGKSSLLNAVAPGLALRIGEIGNVTHKGRHTTSSISLLELPFGGWIADTPGLRQLDFWDVSPEKVAAAFPDLQPYLGRCKYSNCTHGDEPGCTVREALKAGSVDSRRVRSYLQLTGGST
jgi:ribosome biogenesis GTPase